MESFISYIVLFEQNKLVIVNWFEKKKEVNSDCDSWWNLEVEPREMPPPGFNGVPPGPFGCLGSLCHGLCRLVSSWSVQNQNYLLSCFN
ncbi:hypothetical protein F8388_000086 [Cannabis sativa]|uniref:Uncharacterized protein n=1 Tax=Cannabis sativa TaxID=3483 RepID=A0A7J6FPY5_CANSA|nr:hypothetical protein F8388_000086 [Cannabis sativa]